MRRAVALVAASCALIVGCSGGANEREPVRVLTHESFHLPQDALDEFTATSGRAVVVHREPDRTAVVSLLGRLGSEPVVDLVVGIDTLDAQRVIDDGLVEPHRTPGADRLEAQLAVDGDWLTPISYLDACLNYAPSHYVEAPRRIDELPEPNSPPVPPVPTSLAVVANERYARHTLVPDASTSRMGAYFLVALVTTFASEADANSWTDALDAMLRGGMRVAPTWEESYFNGFLTYTASASIDDDQVDALPPDRVSVTWGSAGMAAVYARYQNDLVGDIDIGVVRDGCVRVVNYAALLANGENRAGAVELLNFLTEPVLQHDIGDRFGSRPARADLVSTPHWQDHGVNVEPLVLSPAVVGPQWEQWQLTWGQIVRRFATGDVPPLVVTVPLPDG